MNQSERRTILIQVLLKEHPEYRGLRIPADADTQWQLLRGLLNIREPRRIGTDFLQIQDAYLQEETAAKGITDAADLMPLQPGLYLWQGDITTLKCDAIVNAANRQGHPEPTGQAKITAAFDLPCRYVLHTVGPIINGRVTKADKELLSSCYRSCLELAAEKGLESVAFCCISTGEFHFPNQLAAEIAVQTVKEFLQTPTSIKKVIFNVFKDMDKKIYERLLRTD